MVLKRLTLLFTTLIFSTQAYSHCQQNADGLIMCHDKKINQYANFEDITEWWSATPEQIRNAKCNSPEKITEKEMREHLEKSKSNNLESVSFFGMNFKDEDSHLIDLLRKLTKYDNIFERLGGDKEALKKNQKTFELPKDCNKVECAVNHIFGKELGLKYLYTLDKYQMNMSEYTDKNLDRFKEDEVDLILEAMDDLPSTLFPFANNYPLKHYKRGYGPSATTLANATINLFSPWDDESVEDKRMTIIHEIGHNIGHHFHLDENKEWLDLSGWYFFKEEWGATNKEAITSKYGATNPAEDFAETIVAYRYNPAMLKKRSLEKYEFIKKNVFQGLEFDKEENCQETKSYFSDLIKELPEKLPEEKTYEICINEVGSLLSTNKINLKDCLKKQRLSDSLDDLMSTKDQYKNDDKAKAIIKSAAKNYEHSDSLTEKEISQAQVNIVNTMMTSFKNKFSTILGCENQKTSGWQNFIQFNEAYLKDEFTKVMPEEKTNQLSFEICQKISPKRNASCEDLAPFFSKMLPASQEKEPLKITISGNDCKFVSP